MKFEHPKETIKRALFSNGWLLRALFRNKWLLKSALHIWCGFRTTDKTVFAQMIKSGQTVVDIGANIGTYTFFFSQLVAGKGSVHSFEPVPATFEMLRKRVASHCPLGNVTLVPSALGDKVGESVIYQPGTDHQQSSFARHEAGDWTLVSENDVRAQTVQVGTLDSYIEQAHIKKIDFIKIDVEGYELMCLKGATKSIAKWKPVIYLEVNPLWSSDFGYSPIDIARFLRDLGYTQLFLLLSGDLTPVSDLENQLGKGLDSSADLLCLHESYSLPA